MTEEQMYRLLRHYQDVLTERGCEVAEFPEDRLGPSREEALNHALWLIKDPRKGLFSNGLLGLAERTTAVHNILWLHGLIPIAQIVQDRQLVSEKA